MRLNKLSKLSKLTNLWLVNEINKQQHQIKFSYFIWLVCLLFTIGDKVNFKLTLNKLSKLTKLTSQISSVFLLLTNKLYFLTGKKLGVRVRSPLLNSQLIRDYIHRNLKMKGVKQNGI